MFLMLLLITFTIVASSCGDDKVILKKKCEWKEVISENGDIDRFVDLPIVTNNNSTVVAGKKENKKYLYSINATNGKKNWEWSDFETDVDQTTFKIYTDALVNNNHHLMALSKENVYSIDLNTGTTKWKKQNRYGKNFSGIGNTYFMIDYANNQTQNQFEEAIYTGDVQNSNVFYELTIPPFKRLFPANAIYRRNINQHVPFIKNQDTMLLVTYSKPASTTISLLQPKYGIYNISKKQWLVDDIVLAEPNTYGLLYSTQINNNKAYFTTGYKLLCYDLDTSAKLWEQEINSFFLSVPIFLNNTVIAQAFEGTIYAYDTQSGSKVWQSKNGTLNRGSTLEHHNGIIYYILGGGSTACYGIDATNGILKLQINCPKNEESGFDDIVRIVPQPNGKKAMLVLNTYTHAYGYEAVR